MLFDPLTVTFVICVLAATYGLLFRYVVYELGGMKLVMEKNKQMQVDMKDVQKKYMDAAKARKDHELKEHEGKMNGMAMDMLKMQLKPMLFTLPLLFVTAFIAGQLNIYFADYLVHTAVPIPLPFNHGQLINWRDSLGPIAWFWITFMLVSLAAQAKLGGNNNAKAKGQG